MAEESRESFVPWDGSIPGLRAPQGTQKPDAPTLERPSSAAKFQIVYGIDLNSNPRFNNAIDGKKLIESEMYFMVTPYAFARRCMMRTATVRTLLLERKLPRVITANDQIMVVVSMDWIFGNQNKRALDALGFSPEDYFDAQL